MTGLTKNSWRGMKARCDNPNLDNYEYYGGRGITYCDRWSDYDNFVSDMGERPSDATLDRINPDGDYEPENCRWANLTTQCRNRSHHPRYIVEGISGTMGDHCDRYGRTPVTVQKRLLSGWCVTRAFLTPPKTKHRRKRPKEISNVTLHQT